MFVGTGAVAVATLYCQQAFNAYGVKGQWAVAGTILTALRKYLFSAPNPDDESRFDRSYQMTVDAGGQRRAEGPQLLQMSTTLEKLVLNTRPFWGGKTAAIRTSVFPYPVPSVARWMLPVMYGGENRTAPPGSVSFCSDSLEVTSQVMFVIDGEFFDPPTDGPLRLEAGPGFTFVGAERQARAAPAQPFATFLPWPWATTAPNSSMMRSISSSVCAAETEQRSRQSLAGVPGGSAMLT